MDERRSVNNVQRAELVINTNEGLVVEAPPKMPWMVTEGDKEDESKEDGQEDFRREAFMGVWQRAFNRAGQQHLLTKCRLAAQPMAPRDVFLALLLLGSLRVFRPCSASSIVFRLFLSITVRSLPFLSHC